jgi:hypothetical protein
MQPEGLGKLMEIIDFTGSQIRDLPVCNIAP